MKMMRREAELKTELMQFMRIATDGYQTYPIQGAIYIRRQ